MNPDKTGGSAFPCSHPEMDDPRNPGWTGGGMTLRDYFAAQTVGPVMASILNDMSSRRNGDMTKFVNAAVSAAYEVADAMLEARK